MAFDGVNRHCHLLNFIPLKPTFQHFMSFDFPLIDRYYFTCLDCFIKF